MFASSPGPLAIDRELDGPRCIVRLIGDLDRRTAPDLLAFLAEHSEPGQEVMLDLRELKSIDAAGIGAVLDAQKACAARGGELTTTAAGPDVQRVLERVLEITGLECIGPFGSEPSGDGVPTHVRTAGRAAARTC